jgi:hypothetical protein
MAKDKVGSFNFGYNAKPKKKGGKKKKTAKKQTGKKSNAWRSYVE